MTKIQVQVLGEQVLLPKNELEKLVEIARQSDAIELEFCPAEVSVRDIMEMAEQGKAFAFWQKDGEEIYTAEDGKPV